VYDLVYNPRKTELLKMAEKRGASTMNGLPMLILQGLHALSLWFPEKGSAVFSLEKRLLGRSARAGKRAERRAAVPARGDP
jgi:shikimate 5-dehydrogenase